MRALLINPPTPLCERPNPPLGLGFVAAALEEADVEVRLVEEIRLARVVVEHLGHRPGVTRSLRRGS